MFYITLFYKNVLLNCQKIFFFCLHHLKYYSLKTKKHKNKKLFNLLIKNNKLGIYKRNETITKN